MEIDTILVNLQIWLVGFVVFILAYNYLTKEAWKKLPPGPPTLPIIGSLPFLGSFDIREPLRKMAAKYGDVFTVYLGPRRVVVLNGYDVISEAFIRNAHVFSGRPDIFVFTHLTGGYGIVSSQGHIWREQRRHAMHVLRDFGFGKTVLEDKILEEVQFFLKEMNKNVNKPFYPQSVIQKSVANVISSITFGKRMNYDDPVFVKYLSILNRSLDVMGSNGVINIFPFVRFIPGDLFRVKRLKTEFDFLRSEYERMIEEHKQAVNLGVQTEDFISAYLKKMEQEKEVENSTFSERQLAGHCYDLFVAGTETISTTLAWSIIFMALNQDIQDRVHAEIIDAVGRHDLPRMHHRLQLHFTEACILETQRLGDIVPFGLPHASTDDVWFRGYFIPKGTMIIPNMYSVHRNPKLWPEPTKFKPDRFLDKEGRVDKKELIPFSVGKRLCLGESLARMELFLYFTSMMQRFRFRPAPGHPLSGTKGRLGLTYVPERFHVIVEKRR